MNDPKSQITGIRKIGGGKYSLVLSQIVINKSASLNVAALLNADDDRFEASQPKARQCFMAGTPASIKSLFGIDVDTLTFTANDKGHLVADVTVNSPSILGQELNIELRDSLESVVGFAPKQTKNKEGQILVFVDENGKPIYQGCFPVTGTPKHKIITSAERRIYTQAEMDALVAANKSAAEAKKAAKVELVK